MWHTESHSSTNMQDISSILDSVNEMIANTQHSMQVLGDEVRQAGERMAEFFRQPNIAFTGIDHAVLNCVAEHVKTKSKRLSGRVVTMTCSFWPYQLPDTQINTVIVTNRKGALLGLAIDYNNKLVLVNRTWKGMIHRFAEIDDPTSFATVDKWIRSMKLSWPNRLAASSEAASLACMSDTLQVLRRMNDAN